MYSCIIKIVRSLSFRNIQEENQTTEYNSSLFFSLRMIEPWSTTIGKFGSCKFAFMLSATFWQDTRRSRARTGLNPGETQLRRARFIDTRAFAK
jgi:hypothetical protein